MPRGIYERTPEHNAAISAALKGVPHTSAHNTAVSAAKKGIPRTTPAQLAADEAKRGIPHSPEHCANLSKAHIGVPLSSEHCAALSASRTPEGRAAISESIKNSESAKASQDRQRGGDDIVGHHYIYDHSDLSKYIMKMTRAAHTRLHWLMRKSGIEIPHINMEE